MLRAFYGVVAFLFENKKEKGEKILVEGMENDTRGEKGKRFCALT
jgi:hypothetical protein